MESRYDLFRNIHKGIRAMLFDLVSKSGRTDFTDAEDVASLIGATRDIFELLESHAHAEDTFTMPLVRKIAPELAMTFDDAHEDQERRLPGLLAALESLDPRSLDAAQHGHRFVVQLSRIAGELLTHMADEEVELNAALWSHFTDETLAEVEKQIVGSISPDKVARFVRWMVPALNPFERAEFAAKMPPPVRELIATLT
jgi:hypothetical protein